METSQRSQLKVIFYVQKSLYFHAFEKKMNYIIPTVLVISLIAVIARLVFA